MNLKVRIRLTVEHFNDITTHTSSNLQHQGAMKKTCILSQGTEILSGSVIDTNAHWISNYLYGSQYTVCEHLTGTDDCQQLVRHLQRLCDEYDVIISTGGLGPTADDITRKALSILTNQPLMLHPEALSHLKKYYTKRNRIIPPLVQQQAMLPSDSNCIHNAIGSACGIHLTHNETTLYIFPGVPREMMDMIPKTLILEYEDKPLVFATFGSSESTLMDKLDGLELPNIAFHATRRGHWLTLFPPTSKRLEAIEQVSTRLSSTLFDISETKNSLIEVVAKQLTARKENIATAESCTAGKLSSWFTSIPGSTAYYQEGVIVYSNEAKQKYCGVSEHLIRRKGAVCKAVSIELAKGIQSRAGTSWGIGITGIAGPSGGSKEKPVGTVHIAIFGNQHIHHKHCTFHGTREQITDQATAQAVFMLLNALKLLE